MIRHKKTPRLPFGKRGVMIYLMLRFAVPGQKNFFCMGHFSLSTTPLPLAMVISRKVLRFFVFS